MSFWGSLFGGQNKTLNSDMNQFGQIGGFATGLGESNLSQASNFYSSLLSGDPSKQAKALGPEIGAIQQQGQQARNTTAQFGNRSGGGNAWMQMAGDQSRGSINNMISSLLGGAASSLGSYGRQLAEPGHGCLRPAVRRLAAADGELGQQHFGPRHHRSGWRRASRSGWRGGPARWPGTAPARE